METIAAADACGWVVQGRPITNSTIGGTKSLAMNKNAPGHTGPGPMMVYDGLPYQNLWIEYVYNCINIRIKDKIDSVFFRLISRIVASLESIL